MQLKVSGRKLPFPELLYRKTLARSEGSSVAPAIWICWMLAAWRGG
jgi:hypothetical protein